jgi:hypothetical protein
VIVFVSHGSHDTWIAKQMARCIQECGVEVLIDSYDLASGDDVTEALSGLLERATELVVLFTPFSKSRAWVWMEIGVMRLNRKRVVPVFHGMTKRDLAESGGDGALAGLVERQLNEFDLYLAELKGRVAREIQA